MRIVRTEIFRYSVGMDPGSGRAGETPPRTEPRNVREGLFLRMEFDDGEAAWGEVAPYPGRSAESLDEAVAALRELVDTLTGEDAPATWDGFVAMNPAASAPASVAFGVEQALASYGAKRAGLPLSVWICNSARTAVSVNALLGGNAESREREASMRLAEGYRTFKVKITGSDSDAIRSEVNSVRRIVGGQSELRLDANRQWEFADAVGILNALGDLGVVYVEEPLADPEWLGRLARAVPVPIALDEGFVDRRAQSIREIGSGRIRHGILKPTLVGGLIRTMDLAGELVMAGAEPVVTSVFETDVGMHALVALAAALPGNGLAAGLDTLRFMQEVFTQDAGNLVAPTLRSDRGERVAEVDRRRLVRIHETSA